GLLFKDNETNTRRVTGPGRQRSRPFVKDAFHRQIIGGEAATNPARQGTKACFHYRYLVPGHGSIVLHLRLTLEHLDAPLRDVDTILAERRSEADAFYAAI